MKVFAASAIVVAILLGFSWVAMKPAQAQLGVVSQASASPLLQHAGQWALEGTSKDGVTATILATDQRHLVLIANIRYANSGPFIVVEYRTPNGKNNEFQLLPDNSIVVESDRVQLKCKAGDKASGGFVVLR